MVPENLSVLVVMAAIGTLMALPVILVELCRSRPMTYTHRIKQERLIQKLTLFLALPGMTVAITSLFMIMVVILSSPQAR